LPAVVKVGGKRGREGDGEKVRKGERERVGTSSAVKMDIGPHRGEKG
jgi:hypothetical protein